MVTSTIKTLILICLFRAGPQDLPSSRELLVGCIAAAFAVLFIGYSLLAVGGNTFLLAASNAALIGIGWLIVLQLGRKMQRWHQSACAIYGTTALLNLVSLPIITSGLNAAEIGSGEISQNLRIVIFGLWAWEIAVTARIARATLEIRMGLAVIISIALSFGLQLTMEPLFR